MYQIDLVLLDDVVEMGNVGQFDEVFVVYDFDGVFFMVGLCSDWVFFVKGEYDVEVFWINLLGNI